MKIISWLMKKKCGAKEREHVNNKTGCQFILSIVNLLLSKIKPLRCIKEQLNQIQCPRVSYLKVQQLILLRTCHVSMSESASIPSHFFSTILRMEDNGSFQCLQTTTDGKRTSIWQTDSRQKDGHTRYTSALHDSKISFTIWKWQLPQTADQTTPFKNIGATDFLPMDLKIRGFKWHKSVLMWFQLSSCLRIKAILHEE